MTNQTVGSKGGSVQMSTFYSFVKKHIHSKPCPFDLEDKEPY